MFSKERKGLTTTQIIAFGFLGAIIAGAILLALPISSATGEHTSMIDALFTSTTSVCVTGLVTVPTWAHWSFFGQFVIMLLVEVGGLGVITFTTIVLMIVGKRISMKERLLIQDAYNLDNIRGVVKLTIRIVKGTMIVEGCGALLYAIVFVPEYGISGIWKAIFNSVSAFCNAGMDLLGDNSLASYQGNIIVNFTTMALIILGGLGFPVWWNIVESIKKRNVKYFGLRDAIHHLNLHTKVVLCATACLLVGGTVIVLAFEWSNSQTMGNLPWWQKVMAAMFQSVTTRTAGFFTIPQEGLRNATAFVSIILMFVGGSPSGTAGGVKTTTIWVLLFAVISIIRGRNDTEAFGRKIATTIVKKAMAIFVFSFTILIVSVIVLSIVQNTDFLDALYECTSAIATVGLTRGLTPSLTVAGKIIIIITMYSGRIGPITLALFFNSKKYKNVRSFPNENIGVG